MYRVIYLSSASTPMRLRDLRAILTQADRNNVRDGVTGALLFHDGNFLQILEGPKPAVEACLHRIERDPRHRGLLRLLATECDAPLFPEWSMGFARPQDLANPTRAAVRGFSAVCEDIKRIKATDPRVATLMQAYLATFRDVSCTV